MSRYSWECRYHGDLVDEETVNNDGITECLHCGRPVIRSITIDEIVDEVTFCPKGGMCVVCNYWNDDCSYLEFSKMPVIKEFEDIRIVKCLKFKRSGINK